MTISNQHRNLSPYAGEIMDLLEDRFPFSTFHVWGRYVIIVVDLPLDEGFDKHEWLLIDERDSVRIGYMRDEAGTAEFTTDEPALQVMGMLIAAME